MAYRKITLLIEKPSETELEKIQTWSKDNEIQFLYRYIRNNGDLYYFSIYGETQHYNALQKHLGNKLIQTDIAELGNISDCNDENLEEFSNILNDFGELRNMTNKVHKRWLNFIMPIKDVLVLDELRKYSCHMDETCKELIEDRIHVLKGEPTDWEISMRTMVANQ